jgi:phosphate transport system substrate-binding protein
MKFKKNDLLNQQIVRKLSLFLLLTGLSACGNNTSTQTLTLTGSSTVAPVASELAKEYEQNHANVEINVQGGGSSRGIADAKSGVADIGMASRSLTSEESDLMAHTIARDGVSIIVNSDNPVSSLSNQQIVDIYTDKINNWQEVGGKDAPITVVHKSAGRATQKVFLNFFQLQPQQVVADTIIGENEQGIKTVAGNANAIGYVSIGAAEVHRDNGTAIKLLPLEGIEASSEAVSQGKFPLSRPLNLVTKGQPTGLAQDFIEFAQSPQVHDTIQEQYFSPVSQ